MTERRRSRGLVVQNSFDDSRFSLDGWVGDTLPLDGRD